MAAPSHVLSACPFFLRLVYMRTLLDHAAHHPEDLKSITYQRLTARGAWTEGVTNLAGSKAQGLCITLIINAQQCKLRLGRGRHDTP